MRAVLICLLAGVALLGCGDDGGDTDQPLSAADVRSLEEAREKFLNYCGERKANGADETQPVPPPIADAVSDVVGVLKDHRDASFEFEGQTVTVRAFVSEQVETLENCSDQQEQRLSGALAG